MRAWKVLSEYICPNNKINVLSVTFVNWLRKQHHFIKLINFKRKTRLVSFHCNFVLFEWNRLRKLNFWSCFWKDHWLSGKQIMIMISERRSTKNLIVLQLNATKRVFLSKLISLIKWCCFLNQFAKVLLRTFNLFFGEIYSDSCV